MSNTNTANIPENSEAMPLKLDVRVRPIAPVENLIGFATVTINDCFVVKGLKVCAGENGLYVNMPSQQDGNGNWQDICKPITADFRRQLNEAVVEGYNTAIEKMQATLEAAKSVNEKPSLTGALKENADKVKNQPVKASAAKDAPSR